MNTTNTMNSADGVLSEFWYTVKPFLVGFLSFYTLIFLLILGVIIYIAYKIFGGNKNKGNQNENNDFGDLPSYRLKTSIPKREEPKYGENSYPDPTESFESDNYNEYFEEPIEPLNEKGETERNDR